MITVEERYTVAELAARLKLSRRTIERAISLHRATGGREGLGPAEYFGRACRLPASVVNNWLEGLRDGR